jgi:hypothetical protein
MLGPEETNVARSVRHFRSTFKDCGRLPCTFLNNVSYGGLPVTNRIRLQQYLSVCLLLAVVGNSSGQDAQPQKRLNNNALRSVGAESEMSNGCGMNG